jgi:integrase
LRDLAVKLTDLEIKKAQIDPDSVVRLTDELGLYLEISPGGVKAWRVRLRANGTNTIKTVGHYPKMTLAQARKARDVLRRPADSVTPLPAPPGPTFEVVAREWHERNKDTWKDVHAEDVMRTMKKDLFPEIGDKEIAKLEALEISDLLRKFEARGTHHVTHDLRQRITAIFRYATQRGIIKVNPAADMRDVIKPLPPSKPRPAITDLAGVREVLAACDAIPAFPVTRLAHRLLALTSVRAAEVGLTGWDEFEGLDGTDPLWHIPARRMKGRKYSSREHFIPLAPAAVEVITELRKITGKLPWAFPSSVNGQDPMSENALSFMLKRAGYQDRHCPHGWRASFSTIMNGRRRADRDVIDLMLAHIPKDKVEGAYNRAPHWELRREIACEWAGLLMDGMPPASALTVLPRRTITRND